MNLTPSQKIYSDQLYTEWVRYRISMLTWGANSLHAQGLPTREEISQAKHRFNLRAIKESK